jgi:hypothetical protein
MANTPDIQRTHWTVSERIAYAGYTLAPLELYLVTLYARARFIECEGRFPGETFIGDEVHHIDFGLAQMWEGEEERNARQLLRDMKHLGSDDPT